MDDVTVLHILKYFHNWCIKTRNWFGICFLQSRGWQNDHNFLNSVSRTMSSGIKSEVSLPNVLWLQLTAVQGLCIHFLVPLWTASVFSLGALWGLVCQVWLWHSGASGALAALHGRTQVEVRSCRVPQDIHRHSPFSELCKQAWTAWWWVEPVLSHAGGSLHRCYKIRWERLWFDFGCQCREAFLPGLTSSSLIY